jgi:hypothetical protein
MEGSYNVPLAQLRANDTFLQGQANAAAQAARRSARATSDVEAEVSVAV